MKKGRFLLILLLCIAVLGLAWMLVVTEKSDTERQAELIAQAQELLADKIYIRAEPLLEEAAGYKGDLKLEAEQLLKEVYYALIDESGYRNKLTQLFDAQINREGTPAEVYFEVADYYLSSNKRQDGIKVLALGVEKNSTPELVARYEQERYSYLCGGETYDDVTEVYNNMIQVKKLGQWGLADYCGEEVIPCQYDKISTFGGEDAIVKSGSEVFSIDKDNHRIYLMKEPVLDLGNYGNKRAALKTDAGWVRATGEFTIGAMIFDAIGTYNDGYAAAQLDGKWGVIGTGNDWTIEPAYDGIVMDGIGRCWGQKAVFVRSGNSVYLIVDGNRLETAYEDACPFNAEGWAAVKQNGKWGFVDTNGQLMIPCKYEEARSFSGHLAAVRQGEYWGYISVNDQMVIEPQFLDARYFVNGAAAVKSFDGWQFIILDEYREVENGL